VLETAAPSTFPVSGGLKDTLNLSQKQLFFLILNPENKLTDALRLLQNAQ
jgi:hypothetical protein